VICNKGVKVTSLAAFILIFALACNGMATSVGSMSSYEDLLRNQTLLIGSFENLLKNTTLTSELSYTFLDSFDDLAMREQHGLNSFEDLVSYNWSSLTVAERVALTASFEDLLRREAIILTSNEDLLKRDFCKLDSTQKQELLDRFEARLKYEVVLLKKFEDWLHYQQMIEVDPSGYYDTWTSFLSSFEDLIRRQSNLLDSFEMLMKIDCSDAIINVTKSTNITSMPISPNEVVMYSFKITATGSYPIKEIVVKDSLLGEVGQIAYLLPGAPNAQTFTVNRTLSCADCNNCTCKICNFATACGHVITPNGNFTVCDVSNPVCLYVGMPVNGPIYPVITQSETAEEPAAVVEAPAAEAKSETSGKVVVEVTQAPVEQPKSSGCSVCGKG
jgi:hypothetical protein